MIGIILSLMFIGYLIQYHFDRLDKKIDELERRINNDI